jgi:hypothetical protein
MRPSKEIIISYHGNQNAKITIYSGFNFLMTLDHIFKFELAKEIFENLLLLIFYFYDAHN